MNSRGFTLIELLVVVAMIGILVAAVMINMNKAKVHAFNVVALSCAQDIQNKEKIEQATGGKYEAYADIDNMTACKRLEENEATPTGDAEPVHYLYTARHPKGDKVYTVTDTDIYTDGIGANGKVLADDPAASLATAGGSGSGSTGGSTGGSAGGAGSLASMDLPTLGMTTLAKACRSSAESNGMMAWYGGSFASVVEYRTFNSSDEGNDSEGLLSERLSRVNPNTILQVSGTTYSLWIATDKDASFYDVYRVSVEQDPSDPSLYTSADGTHTLAEYQDIALQRAGAGAALATSEQFDALLASKYPAIASAGSTLPPLASATPALGGGYLVHAVSSMPSACNSISMD